MRLGRAGMAGLATAGALVVAAGVSWACTPQASVVTSPGTASAGSTVTVTGGSFYSGAGYGAVEVRWDGGVLLASAPGPSFSLQVQVPNAPPGVYSVVAQQKDAQGAVAGTASTAFTVSDPATTTPTGSQPSSTSGTSATTTSRTRQAPTSGSPTPATADAEAAPAPEAGATPAEGAPATSASPAPATSSATPSASTASPSATASSPRTAARATSAGRSPLASASPAPASPLAPAAVEEPEAPGVSARTAGADLWSGLARGSSPTRGAGLDVPPARHDRAPATTAAALSVAVAAASALALAATRRRRAVVTSQ